MDPDKRKGFADPVDTHVLNYNPCLLSTWVGRGIMTKIVLIRRVRHSACYLEDYSALENYECYLPLP